MAFVCLLRINLHFPEGSDLKGKRKEISSLKAQLRRRFGASVAETDHHDHWQRSTLTAALVAREHGEVQDEAASLARFVESRHPDGSWVERATLSSGEVLDP